MLSDYPAADGALHGWLSHCPAVIWLSGEGWLHRLGPWSRSRWGLGEVWERQESMLRPPLCSMTGHICQPHSRTLGLRAPETPDSSPRERVVWCSFLQHAKM